MRVSSLDVFNIANNSISRTSQELLRTQEQISSGQRVVNPSDDPVAATRILAINEELATNDQYLNNISAVRSGLELQDSSLNSSLNVIQRVQELAVQAGNTAVLSSSDYLAISNEVEALTNELQNILNTQDVDGSFIFSGFKSQSPPFTGSIDTGFQFNGDEGQKNIQIANNSFIQASDSGKFSFVDIPTDNPTVRTSLNPANNSASSLRISVAQIDDREQFNGFAPEDLVISFNEDAALSPAATNYTITERSTGRIVVANQVYQSGQEVSVQGLRFTLTGNPVPQSPTSVGDQVFIESSNQQDILTTLAQFSLSLRSFSEADSTEAREQISTTVADTINNLDRAQTSVLEVRSQIGTRLNTLDNTEILHQDANLSLRTLLADIRDLDFAEASTRLSSQTLILEAAQTAFVRVSRLNLFNQL